MIIRRNVWLCRLATVPTHLCYATAPMSFAAIVREGLPQKSPKLSGLQMYEAAMDAFHTFTIFAIRLPRKHCCAGIAKASTCNRGSRSSQCTWDMCQSPPRPITLNGILRVPKLLANILNRTSEI